MRNSFELNTHLFFVEEIFISVLLWSQTILLNRIFYWYKSFLRINIKTWNLFRNRLKTTFYYLEFLFLIYELDAVVSYIAMFFIQQHRPCKCYMQTFSGQDLLRFACCVSFLFINVFLTNFWLFMTFFYYCTLNFFYPLT